MPQLIEAFVWGLLEHQKGRTYVRPLMYSFLRGFLPVTHDFCRFHDHPRSGGARGIRELRFACRDGFSFPTTTSETMVYPSKTASGTTLLERWYSAHSSRSLPPKETTNKPRRIKTPLRTNHPNKLASSLVVALCILGLSQKLKQAILKHDV